MEAVREKEVKLRGVGFVKEVGFKLGVKERWSYRCTKWWIRRGKLSTEKDELTQSAQVLTQTFGLLLRYHVSEAWTFTKTVASFFENLTDGFGRGWGFRMPGPSWSATSLELLTLNVFWMITYCVRRQWSCVRRIVRPIQPQHGMCTHHRHPTWRSWCAVRSSRSGIDHLPVQVTFFIIIITIGPCTYL